MTEDVRVRIAPSPTGNLHLGTARTALYNYLYALGHNGKFIFRLEDTDNERSDEKFSADIIEGLRWLGINWQEGPDIGGPFAPYRQTEKIDHYQSVANKLLASGYAYLCYATPEELQALKEDQREKGQGARYDNRGRNLTSQDKERFKSQGRIPSIRFRIEEPQDITWEDGIKGKITVNGSDLGGDMVIVKSNGVATYNFAVVCDDIDMNISLVLRGEDHIHNTAKQLLIFEALRAKPPKYAHTALIFDTDHKKLSKRLHGASVHIDAYRADGYMPEALVNYLLQMSFSPPDGEEIFTLEHAGEIFDLKRISKSPAVFDIDKLNWFNAHYIRNLPLDTVAERARPFFKHYNLDEYSQEEYKLLVATLRESLSKLSEIEAAASSFFGTGISIPDDLKESVLKGDEPSKVLTSVLEKLDSIPFNDPPGAKALVDEIGKLIELKGKKLYWPIRVALSGSTQGPDLGAIICIMGKKRVRARLEAALNLCNAL
ncbi:MAG: glutamate--tRNA ligase [Candidatus Obscuribacterales bacterium]|nr:glutamate--tRNA ligase [Candidatus Obscuribacterales bacterium]